MDAVLFYLPHSTHHLEERFKRGYSDFEVCEHAVVMDSFERYAGGDSRTIYKHIVLGPSVLHVFEVFYALAFVGVLSEQLHSESLVYSAEHGFIHCLRDLSIAARNNDSLARVNRFNYIMQPQVFAILSFIHDVPLLALPGVGYEFRFVLVGNCGLIFQFLG